MLINVKIFKLIAITLIFTFINSLAAQADTTYRSVAEALGAGDVSAAAQLMNARSSISPAASRNMAIASALSVGDINRAAAIIYGPAPDPGKAKQIDSQRVAALNAITNGDMNGAARAVFGQDVEVAIALSTGDISSAVSAIQQGKKIDQEIRAKYLPSSQSNSTPSSGTSSTSIGSSSSSEVPSIEIRSQYYGNTNEQYLKAQSVQITSLYSAVSSLKVSLNRQLSALEKVVNVRLVNLNDSDKNKFLNSDIYIYMKTLEESISSIEDFDPAITANPKDSNWYNAVIFSVRYDVEKIMYINKDLRNISTSVLKFIPSSQCQNIKSREKKPLDSSGKCAKNFKKIRVSSKS